MVLGRGRARPTALAAVALLLLLGPDRAEALDNGVARTPALGWSSWNYFEDDINETLIMGIAHGLVSSGARDVGYTYLNLDAGAWSPNRTASGELQADPSKFPSGLASLSAQLRGMGLKLGLYINLGTHTASCGRTGSFGRYAQDAATLATLGCDFLKVDYCGGPPAPPPCTTTPHPCQSNRSRTYCLSVSTPGQCQRPPISPCPPCPPAPPPAPPPPADGDPFVPALPDQLKSWRELRDALNRTGRPIYSYFCPRSCGGTLDTRGNFSAYAAAASSKRRCIWTDTAVDGAGTAASWTALRTHGQPRHGGPSPTQS